MNTQSQDEVIKVAIVGPECTGKTDLSSFLANHYKTGWVPEYARGYLDNLVRPYEKEDLTTIAHGQLRLEDVWLKDANKVLFYDTSLLVIKIWSEFKFGECDPEIVESMNEEKFDLYLLTYIDIPWQDDPQREHPTRREELYSIYLTQLQQMGVPFVEVKGEKDARRKTAIEAVDKVLQQHGK